ncbi:MAG: DUF4011 domain-containing protein [Clostridia bacterium]|nr:DUF4011 domain-containing protein [Clostridia bacterium]
MGKSIYTYYKERLVEIGGSSKCLYLKSIVRRSAYDIGKILEGRDGKIAEFIAFLWSDHKYPLSLINPKEKKDIVQNLDIESKIQKRRVSPADDASEKEIEKAIQKNERVRREEATRAFESELSKIKDLQREIEEIEKETGRYELFLGYPFVFGVIGQGSQKTVIKAPLLLFPVKIDIPDDSNAEIRFNDNEKVRINPALVFAYAQSKRIDVDQLDLEFDDLSDLPDVDSVIRKLRDAHIDIQYSPTKNVFGYAKFKEPEERSSLSVRCGAVLARFPLSNSIYNDYSELEKKKLTNDAINELLRTGKKPQPQKKKKASKKPSTSYTVKMLDYAQAQVVRKVDENGNMVIYGPPGTGKSQTIVNVITDAIAKNKNVLVVSQKKAALDVVYNRLGTLNEKCMYVNDESKDRLAFYTKCYDAHTREMLPQSVDIDALDRQYEEIESKIAKEKLTLDSIYETLNKKRAFGLSLFEMYNSSAPISKNSSDYQIYTALIDNVEMMRLSYKELSEALISIKSGNLEKLYYDFLEAKEKNPLIDLMQADIDIRTLTEVKGTLLDLQKAKKGFFSIASCPYYRQILAHYKEISDPSVLDSVVDLECKINRKGGLFKSAERKEMKEQFIQSIKQIDRFAEEYKFLLRILSEDGYVSVIDNLLRGNHAYIKLVYEALDGYIAMRDVTNMVDTLNENKLLVLNFAYTTAKSYANYTEILEKLLEIRIYHELVGYEESCKDDLSKLVDYQSVCSKIARLKEAQLEIATKIVSHNATKDYPALYNEGKDNKDYLYQISKKQKLWPLRKTVEFYGQYILKLFPCWLLSPENVSSILPLTKNLFDVVIFDEASQVFIENTLPSIYRGKNIVVAGDAKQLRPSTTFMKRYLGGNTEDQDDISVQAALEVDSLLDLAVARYESANLTYHYRSRSSELIDFSNNAFYSSSLQISPNLSKNALHRPIERYMVNGKWADRKNLAEATKVVDILVDIFKNRKNNESIGIISFNNEQQTCIADLIDAEMAKNPEFRAAMKAERHRSENGEDSSIFIKNLENVQGDERDIIIFSIGYANNEQGKLYTNFGSLSAEGGENRLNVAITRAKTKVIVVTSIEPEALKVEGAKNLGPKLLKKYLEFVRAVSASSTEDASRILRQLDPQETEKEIHITKIAPIDQRIKERLTKLGYTVETDIGGEGTRISLAIYDEKLDRYLLGIVLDQDAYESSDSAMERDVYKPMFLESKGWNLLRVWSRDWWLYPTKVIKTITDAVEAARKKTSKS